MERICKQGFPGNSQDLFYHIKKWSLVPYQESACTHLIIAQMIRSRRKMVNDCWIATEPLSSSYFCTSDLPLNYDIAEIFQDDNQHKPAFLADHGMLRTGRKHDIMKYLDASNSTCTKCNAAEVCFHVPYPVHQKLPERFSWSCWHCVGHLPTTEFQNANQFTNGFWSMNSAWTWWLHTHSKEIMAEIPQ